MSKLARVPDSLALMGAIALCVACWSALRADDGGPETHDCPFCGSKDVVFENSPEGAFRKMKFALATGDADMLRECCLGLPEDEYERMKKSGKGDASVGKVVLRGARIDGDKATIETESQGKQVDLPAVRDGGAWKIDMREGADNPLRHAALDRDCVNNLRQLGTYIVMYVSKYGSDRFYSGPGRKLFSDMYALPDATSAIARGNEVLLVCKRSGDKGTVDRLRKGDWDAMSYECWEGQVSDGATPPDAAIAWDKTPCHGGRRNVLLFSGAVFPMTEEELAEAKKKHKK